MQAPAYNRIKNFTENNPDRTDHGAINAELDNVSLTVNTLRDNAAKIQKDDGSLASSVVTIDSLTQEAVNLLKVPGQAGPAGPRGPQGELGPRGEKGDVGSSFNANAADVYANRLLYNAQPKGFSFLATDLGQLYFKKSDTISDWSTGFVFGKGEKGDKGDRGDVGPQGSQGIQGIKGDKGDPGSAGIPGVDGLVVEVDTTLKTASLIGRSSVNARLVITNGLLSILLTTA